MVINISDVDTDVTNSNQTNKLNAMRMVANSAIIMAIITLITNLLAIVILAKCKRMICQIKIMSINLALTDFTLAVFSIIDAVLAIYGLNVKLAWCIIRGHIDIMLVVTSICSITVFGLDRLLSLVFALRYQARVSQKRIIAVSILTWVIALIITALTYIDGFDRPAPCICFDNEGHSVISLVFRNACFLLIVLAYAKIFWTVKQQNNRIAGLRSQETINLKPALKISIIVAAVFFMYFPRNLVMIYHTFTNQKVQPNLRLFTVVSYIEKLNSLVNPFLYVWRFSECRIHLLRIFCVCSSRLKAIAQRMEHELTGSYMASVDRDANSKLFKLRSNKQAIVEKTGMTPAKTNVEIKDVNNQTTAESAINISSSSPGAIVRNQDMYVEQTETTDKEVVDEAAEQAKNGSQIEILNEGVKIAETNSGSKSVISDETEDEIEDAIRIIVSESTEKNKSGETDQGLIDIQDKNRIESKETSSTESVIH